MARAGDLDILNDQLRQTVAVADGLTALFILEHELVIAESESVFVDGAPVPESLYCLDAGQGFLLLRFRPKKWSVVRVSYRCIDYGSAGKASGRYAAAAGSSTWNGGESRPAGMVGQQVDSARVGSSAVSSGLTLTGSKSLGFSVGTRGAELEQVTRIAVGGEFEGIAVEAELSDQSAPLLPEGTTRELEELDQIAVAVSGQNWRGSFGDVGVSLNAGALGSTERRATGAVLAGSFGLASTRVAYARPRGEYGRVELSGIDRVQGPYLLAPAGRSVQIVPGSEEVFLDGVLMTRGWDEDYTIDYSSGELLFTSRHVIDGRSRISASFQFVTEAYERSVTGGEVVVAGGEVGRAGRVELTTGAFSEGDDPRKNLTEELGEAERKYLGSIGSDTTRAWLPGASYVGRGGGEYEWAGDHYRYVGRSKGDYVVRFTHVGEARGAYVYSDSSGAFVYVGPGAGTYVDSVRAVLPRRNEVAFCRLGYGLEGLVVRSDAAFQRRSLNLFAEDGSRVDAGAANVEFGWQDSVYDLRCRLRTKAAGFDITGGSDVVDFARRWGGMSEAERRSSSEISGRVKLLPEVELRGELGRLLRLDGREVNRVEGTIRLWQAEWTGEKAASVTRQKVAFSPGILWLRPSAGVETESDDTARVLGFNLGAGFAPRSGLVGQCSGRLLDYWEGVGGRWVRAGRGSLVQSLLDWSTREGYRLEAVFAHQARWPFGGEGQSWNQFQGNVAATLTPRAGFSVQAEGSQTYRRVQLKHERFYYVGSGQGQYRLDSISGRFVYDPDGEYRRELVATDRFAAARELAGSATTSLSLSLWNLTGTVSANQARTDTGALNGSATGDIRVERSGSGSVPNLVIGVSGSSGFNRAFVHTGREVQRLTEFMELSRSGTVFADARLRLERTDALRRFSSNSPDYTEGSWRCELGSTLARPIELEAVVGTETKLLSEPVSYPELGRFRVSGADLKLTRPWQVDQYTRVVARVGIAWWFASTESVPGDVALMTPPGLTPSAEIAVERMVGDMLTGSFQYNYTDRPDRDGEHTFTAGLRAYF